MGPLLSPGCLGVVTVAMSGGTGLDDGDAGDPPLEDAVGGSPGGESAGVQLADGVVGQDQQRPRQYAKQGQLPELVRGACTHWRGSLSGLVDRVVGSVR